MALVAAILLAIFVLPPAWRIPVVLAWLRWKYFEVGFLRALAIVTGAGIIIAAISAGLGSQLG